MTRGTDGDIKVDLEGIVVPATMSGAIDVLLDGQRVWSFNPDRDGFKRDAGTVKLGFAPAAGHRIGMHLLETRGSAAIPSAGSIEPTPSAVNRARCSSSATAPTPPQ